MGIKAGMLSLSSRLQNDSGTLDVDLTQAWAFSALSGTLGDDLDADGYTLTGLAAPVEGSDATTKTYVDDSIATVQGLINGNAWKDNVKLATTGNLSTTYSNGTSGVGATLTATANGSLLVDGMNPTVDARILVKNQTTGAQNGIYVVTNTGGINTAYILTRATDADSSADLTSAMIAIDDGTQQDLVYFCTTGSIVVGTTSLVFAAWGGATLVAGDGITITGGEILVKIDDSTINFSGADAVQVKDFGLTPAKLGFKWAKQAFTDANSSAVHSSGVSTFTLSTAVHSAAYTDLGDLVGLFTDGVRTTYDGADFIRVSATPANDGEFQITGSSLKIFGNWTSAPEGTCVTVMYPVTNS